MSETSEQSSEFKTLTANGLWKNNPALVQLLGLCPLLAVTSSVVNATGLGLATLLVLVGSNLVVSLIRSIVTDAIKLPAFVMIIAAFTTCAELLMQAYSYTLYQILGIFIPLIVTNCAILGRADAYACKNPPLRSAYDGFIMGLGFFWVLIVIGAVREVLGTGSIFANMNLLIGPLGEAMEINVLGDNYQGLLIAILPPGAFIVAGLLIAAKNFIDMSLANRAKANKAKVPIGSKRVRTTGVIS